MVAMCPKSEVEEAVNGLVWRNCQLSNTEESEEI